VPTATQAASEVTWVYIVAGVRWENGSVSISTSTIDEAIREARRMKLDGCRDLTIYTPVRTYSADEDPLQTVLGTAIQKRAVSSEGAQNLQLPKRSRQLVCSSAGLAVLLDR
jgi:hypothetical protein